MTSAFMERQNQAKDLGISDKHSLMQASVMREAAFCAAVTRKLLSGYFSPPAKKEHPKTRSKLDRMDPSICVKCCGQFLRDITRVMGSWLTEV